MMRALYGKRVNNPMGPDFGVSQRLFEKMLGAKAGGNQFNLMASLTPTALCQNLQIIEVHFGSRIYPATDWSNMSSVLADVLTPVFVDMERNAPCWQRSRVSEPVRVIGEPLPLDQDSTAVDTRPMLESFQLGNRELQEIWSLVLPPATLFELRKLSRLSAEEFRMPDELWVRIVYDFALAHRLRTISRDHLLRSMTPLYLGWVASYAHDLTVAGAMSPERRLERLSLAYEAGKSYPGFPLALARPVQSLEIASCIGGFMWQHVKQALVDSTARFLTRFAKLLPGLAALIIALLVSAVLAWILGSDRAASCGPPF